MPPIHNLQQRLSAIDPYVPPAKVKQLMQQHGAQLRGRKVLRQRAREQNDGAEQAAHRGGLGMVR
jgi:hypothetical protein